MPNYLDYNYWLQNLIVPVSKELGYSINEIKEMNFIDLLEIKRCLSRESEMENARSWFARTEQEIKSKLEYVTDSKGQQKHVNLRDINAPKKEIYRLYGNKG